MFQIPTELTVLQWWWYAIAILLAGLSGLYGERAKQSLWLIGQFEKKKEETIKPEYNATQAKIIYFLAIVAYIIACVGGMILSPY